MKLSLPEAESIISFIISHDLNTKGSSHENRQYILGAVNMMFACEKITESTRNDLINCFVLGINSVWDGVEVEV